MRNQGPRNTSIKMTDHPAGDEVRAFGPFRIRLGERLLERDGAVVPLGGRALDLLVALTARPGEVLSNQELADQIWPRTFVDYARLRFHVTALRKALGDGVDGARYITNVPGRGYCFVRPMARPLPPQSPPEAGSALMTRTIPPRLRRVVGRDVEVAAIAALLASRRFVTIVGPSGIGKTTVAVSVGHAYAADYGSVCFADLGSLSDPGLAASALAAALGVVVNSDDLLPRLLAFLRGKRMLLILDSCEHVIETVSGLAEAIFEQAGEVHILATSREVLRIDGEHVHRLAPLDCPPVSDALTAAESLRFSAVQLFADRASADSDRFALLDADAPAVARICRKLDGIALAIELAAGRVDAHGVVGVEALLDSRLSLLWQGRRTALPRHQTLNAALDWSFDLLTDLERTILRRLAVLTGAFALEAAQAVAQDDQVDGDQVIEVIASLVAKSLVMSDPHHGKRRYRLLDTTCAYLRGKLADPREITMAARRHAEFFRDFLGQIGSEAEPLSQSRGFTAYGEHLGNIRSALEWSFSDEGDVGVGTALAAAAAPLFIDMSLLTECRRWTERALDAYDAAAGDPRIEMELQALLGLSLMFTEGNGEAALAAITRARDLAERLGELGQQLRLIGCLNLYHYRSGDYRGAAALANVALEVARKMADPAALEVAEWMVGLSQHTEGDQRSVVIHCRSAWRRPVANPHADFMRHGLSPRIRALGALAWAQWACGDADEAVETSRYAVAEADSLGDPVSSCVARFYAAFVFLWVGNLPEAEAIIAQVASDAQTHSLTPYQAVAQALLGDLTLRRGDATTAVPLLRGSVETMRTRRYAPSAPLFTGALAEGLAMSGRLDEALATVDEAVSDVESVSPFDMPEMLRLKGVFLAKMGSSNLAAAEDCFDRSLALARQQGALGWGLRTAMAIARLRLDQGRRAAAHDALAPVYTRFTQGMDTVDLRAARELLDACGSLPSPKC
ncbi:MAG: Signal transduction response regulator Disease resistance protein Tetratricopeptide [Caulobacteraceae bacterium]|nr:Signal transduction response regulator Disease resistance protein Tetratricopeptide [Caulobacteraceae bacterium]